MVGSTLGQIGVATGEDDMLWIGRKGNEEMRVGIVAHAMLERILNE